MLAVGALALSACSNGGGDAASTDGAAAGGDSFKIGVIQLVQHPALDAATEGFQQAFADAGISAEFDVQVANGAPSTAATIAAGFAGDSDIDLVLAGHDHSYTRTHLMDGTTPVLPEGDGAGAAAEYAATPDTNPDDGHDIVHPKDGQVIYITANSSSGSKFESTFSGTSGCSDRSFWR